MLQTALRFLDEHKEITLATCEGNLPKLRVFQVMKREGNMLYFATSPEKAVWRELQQNPNVELLAYADNVSVRCSGMVNFNVEEFAIQRENNYKKTGSSKAAFQTGCGNRLVASLVEELRYSYQRSALPLGSSKNSPPSS